MSGYRETNIEPELIFEEGAGRIAKVEYRDGAVFVYLRAGLRDVGVRLTPNNYHLRPGDILRWQNYRAFWTSANRRHTLVEIEKLGRAWAPR